MSHTRALDLRARSGEERCGFCLAPLADAVGVCPGCGVALHAECWAEQHACPTLGCVHNARPAPPVVVTWPHPGPTAPAEAAPALDAGAAEPPAAPAQAAPLTGPAGVAPLLADPRRRGGRARRLLVGALLAGLLVLGWVRLTPPHRIAYPFAPPPPAPIQPPPRLDAPGVDLLHPVLADAAWYAAGGGGKPDMVLAGLRLRWLALARDGSPPRDPWADCAPGATARVRVEITGREGRLTHELSLTLAEVGPDWLLVRVQEGPASWIERWARRPQLRPRVSTQGPRAGQSREIEGVLRTDLSGVQGQFDTGEDMYAFSQPGLPLPWRAAIRRGINSAVLTLLEWSPGPGPAPAQAR